MYRQITVNLSFKSLSKKSHLADMWQVGGGGAQDWSMTISSLNLDDRHNILGQDWYTFWVSKREMTLRVFSSDY